MPQSNALSDSVTVRFCHLLKGNYSPRLKLNPSKEHPPKVDNIYRISDLEFADVIQAINDIRPGAGEHDIPAVILKQCKLQLPCLIDMEELL